MRTTVVIENLKCDDCRPSILGTFNRFKGISNVVSNVALGSLSFDYTSHNVLEGLRMYLKDIGHAIISDPTVITETNEA